jgi:hypothetical protein
LFRQVLGAGQHSLRRFTLVGRRTISVAAVLAAAYDPRVGKTELNDVEAKPRSKYEKMGSNG